MAAGTGWSDPDHTSSRPVGGIVGRGRSFAILLVALLLVGCAETGNGGSAPDPGSDPSGQGVATGGGSVTNKSS